jgi:F-type H+-transporting ATPase subunit c
MLSLHLLHFCSIAFCTVATGLGVSRSHGKTSAASIDAIDRQPAMRPEIFHSTILALALIETAAILGLLMSMLLLLTPPANLPTALAEVGIALSIGIPGLLIGWFSAAPGAQALHAIARQPFIARRMNNFMLLMLSLVQTPLIFGLITALLIHARLAYITTVAQGLTLLGAGLAIGLGSVGPIIGSCLFAQEVCKSAGRNSVAFPRLFFFTFFSQAIIETPVIFSIIIGLMLIKKSTIAYDNPLIGLLCLVIGTTIGIGTFGAGISSGRTAAAAAKQIGYNPESYSSLYRGSMMAQGIIDTIAIYAFVVSLWLILTPLI